MRTTKFALLVALAFIGSIWNPTAHAGVITCDAILDHTSSPPTDNPGPLRIVLDYEPNGTTLTTSAPIGWNHEILPYMVVYSEFHTESRRRLIVATGPLTSRSSLMKLEGILGTSDSVGLQKLQVGEPGVFGEMGKHLTYNLACN